MFSKWPKTGFNDSQNASTKTIESSIGQQGVQTITENAPRRIGQSLRRHPELLLP
jgi:hypothetical protein